MVVLAWSHPDTAAEPLSSQEIQYFQTNQVSAGYISAEVFFIYLHIWGSLVTHLYPDGSSEYVSHQV
jgi:hypothetical protein